MVLEKKYGKSWIGREFKTNQGYEGKVIDGGSKGGYCTIQIEDWISEVRTQCVERGTIKYPYHPSVYGKGYFGVGEHKCETKGKVHVKSYSVWSSMMQRCYDPKYHITRPTYIGCSVEPKWHNYQVFAEWFYLNYKDGWVLDKDLLIKGNKKYNEDNCIFIPARLNSFLSNKQRSNTTGEIGVSFQKNCNKFSARINNVFTSKSMNLGLFNTIEDASNAYKEARVIQCENIKEVMINDYNIKDLRILNNIR